MAQEKIVPEETKLAAKRGFVRTLAQGYESALAGVVVSGAAIVGFFDNPDWKMAAVIGATWLLTPFIGATRSYMGFIGNGIPEDYANAIKAGAKINTND